MVFIPIRYCNTKVPYAVYLLIFEVLHLFPFLFNFIVLNLVKKAKQLVVINPTSNFLFLIKIGHSLIFLMICLMRR